MLLSFRHLAVLFVLALTALPLRAQYDLTPSLLELPPGHSWITGLEGIGDTDQLFTIDEFYITSLSDPRWTKIGSLRSLGIRAITDTTIAHQPGGPLNTRYVTAFDGDDSPALFVAYQLPSGAPAQSHIAIPGFGDLPKDIALTSDGAVYLIDPDHRLWRADDANLTNFSRLTDPVSTIDQINIGPDGTVYAADWQGEIYRFSSDGTMLNQFSLSGGTSDTEAYFAVSSSNILYSFDLASPYGGIYDATDGNYLGRFSYDSGDVGYPLSQGGVPLITLATDPTTGTERLSLLTGTGRYLYTYDVTGVPEPSTYLMTLAGLALCGLAYHRRKRRLLAVRD